MLPLGSGPDPTATYWSTAPAAPALAGAHAPVQPVFVAPSLTTLTSPTRIVRKTLTLTGPAGSTAVYTITDSRGSVITGSAAIGDSTTASFDVDVSALADGALTVTVVEKDIWGNSSDPVTTAWVKDTTAPTVVVTIPAPTNGGAYDIGSPLAFAWITSDATAVTSSTAKIDGTTALVSGAGINVDALTAGIHTITITTTDVVGNIAITTVTFTLRPTATGLQNAVTDGFNRGLLTAAMQSTLLGTLKSINNGNAKAKLSQFINTVKGGLGTSVNMAYGNLLLNWANDLLARS